LPGILVKETRHPEDSRLRTLLILPVEMASPSMRWVWPLPYKVIELYEVSADPGACGRGMRKG
jgi:hypothetical protein